MATATTRRTNSKAAAQGLHAQEARGAAEEIAGRFCEVAFKKDDSSDNDDTDNADIQSHLMPASCSRQLQS